MKYFVDKLVKSCTRMNTPVMKENEYASRAPDRPPAGAGGLVAEAAWLLMRNAGAGVTAKRFEER